MQVTSPMKVRMAARAAWSLSRRTRRLRRAGTPLNNCPVGGALRFVAPEYAMVGVPVTMYAYVSWRPDANSPAQPTNGTAVIRVDGEDYSGGVC